MKPRSTSTIIEKTEKAELVRVEYKGKTFYRVFFNIRPNDGSGLPGWDTMADCKDGFGDDEGAARAFFEEKKNGEQAAEEAKAEEKKEAEADETPAKEKDILTMSAERTEEKAAFSTIALAESILRPFAEDANVQKNLEMLRNVKLLIADHAPNAQKLMAKLKDMDAFIGQARKIADTAAAKIAAAM
jgi:hypothetical protein